MDTVEILFTLRDVSSFLELFLSDLLPQSITQDTTNAIVNADHHTGGRSNSLAICTSDPNLRVPTTLIRMASYIS